MKTLVSLLFLFVIPFISNAQSQDWKQIESPFKTSIYIIHQTSLGYLFGKMNHTDQMFFSNDNGQTWRYLTHNIGSDRNNRLMIREDSLGNIYHTGAGGVYKLNLVTLGSHQIINVMDVFDFAILKNGNFIVATNRNLTLYSGHTTVLHQHSWWTHSAHFLLDPDEQKHFVLNSHGASKEIVEFNDDLSFIGEDKSTNFSSTIVRNGSRLFREKSFSEDGVSWQSLNFQPNSTISTFNAGHDGRLFFISEDQLFISDDNGNTFSQVEIPLEIASFVSSDLSGEIVISQLKLHSPEFYLSNDSGANWNLVIHDTGLPFLLDFTAGVDENLYFRNSLNRFEYYYKKNEWTDWDKSYHPEGFYYTRFASFSDGSTSALSQNGKMYETKNYGAEWDLMTDHLFGWFFEKPMEEKSGVLYHVNSDKMHYSHDFGRNWETLLLTDTALWYSFSPYIFIQSANFGTYSFTYGNTAPSKLVYYNFLTKQKIENVKRPDIYYYASSYNEEILYGLRYNNDGISLCVSKNYGGTFTCKIIEGFNVQNQLYIKTDHLNNIYVYSQKQVFYSFDDGDSWINITPDFPEIHSIRDLQVSYDNYIYVSTVGKGLLKFKSQLVSPRTLNVIILDDQNKNCEIEDDENPLSSVKVLVNGLSLRQPDENGLAKFKVNTLINEVEVIFNPDLFEQCESSYIVEFEETDTELHLDIPLKVLKYCADPVVGLSVPFLRRCFDNTYSGSVCNEGNIESINTEIELTLDPFFDFISATLPIKSINGQIIVLDAGHLQPGQCQSFHFVVNVSCNSDLGQEHCISAYTSTGSVDCGEATARDAYLDCQTNIGAYDPNDKNIFVNGNRNQSYIEPGDKIEYLIRFQNTGTDTAFTVRIEDPITKKFNISSLKPVAASHDYTWSVNNGMLIVLFEDIQLVDSFKNEPASHGFIKFEIQLDSLTLRGDDVKNLAGIFFDFNEPIITEEVVTVIGQPLSTKESLIESITAFPNPANGMVYISGNALSDKPQDLLIYDINGKLILSQKISHHDNRIDISKCTPGTYMLMMKSGEKVYRGKLLKM